MPSLLNTILNDPLAIRDYLYNHLEEISIKTNSKHYINHPSDNIKAFTWAHVIDRMNVDIPDAFIYKFNRLDLFYAFIFDDYTDAQIRQLESALTFIERLFNAELIEFDKSPDMITIYDLCLFNMMKI